jgi:hypothetical protein
LELTSDLAEDLIHRGFETEDLDFKKDFDNSTRSWVEIAKDAYGMANYGGGFIVIGVEDGTFKPIGLDISFHIDTQVWHDKINKWVSGKLNISYLEHITQIGGVDRKFPILQIRGSCGSFVVPKTDGQYLENGETKLGFKIGVVYTRKGTSTIQALGDDLFPLFISLIKRTTELTGSLLLPIETVQVLISKTKPDETQENLWFNLFPVSELPDTIHSAETDCRFATEVYVKISLAGKRQNRDFYISPFFLGNKRMYTFSPIANNNLLTICANSKTMEIPTKDWFDDLSKHHDLTELLNFNLKDLLWKRKFYQDTKGRFFIRHFEGPLPEITWKPYKASSTRKLVNPKYNKLTGQLNYYEHFSGTLRFRIMGKGIYLIIEPIRVLTKDGVNPLDQEKNLRISTKKNVHYSNINYLYDMKLWLHILAGSKDEIEIGYGSDKIRVSVHPIDSKASFGLTDDQYTGEDILDELKSDPLEFSIKREDGEDQNPLTDGPYED